MNSSLRLVIILAFITFANAFGQDPDLKEVFLEAESYFLFEEYNEALPLYLRLNRADPENDNVNYKIGICFLNDPYQKEKSIRYLEKASLNTNPDFRINKYRERTAPMETFFYLGMAYLVNNQIDKALENFQKFKEVLDPDVYDVQLVDEQIDICNHAIDLMSKPVDFDRVNLSEPLNSRFADMNPVISGDGNKLVYVAKLPFYDATYFTEKVDGEWLPPRNIIPELGVDGDVYPTALSYDGNTMIIYRNDDFIGNLYTSKYIDGKWTNMVKLEGHISTKYWESHGSFSRDQKTLYFTSNRKGGYGGLDIYRSDLNADGSWGEPVNLGPVINTRYNEETPFITANGQYLYFSSYGHYNMGGYDIFYSKKDDKGKWAEPVNLGYPVNTTDDDIFFQPFNNGNNAYFSMFSPDGYGRHDLYYMDIYSENNPRLYLVKGSLSPEEGILSEEDDVRIYLIDRMTGDTIYTARPDLDDNTFLVEVPRGSYNIVVRSNSYEDAESTVVIDENTSKTGIELPDNIMMEIKEYIPLLLAGELSRIIIEDTLLTARPGDVLPIRMRLERDAELVARLSVDSVLTAVDTFKTDKRRFTYELTVQEGTNMLELKMKEPNGDVSTKTVLVEGIAPWVLTDSVSTSAGPVTDTSTTGLAGEGDPAAALAPQVNQDSINNALREIVERLMRSSEGSLLKALQALEVDSLNAGSTRELMKILDDRADADGYTSNELYVAAGKTIAGNNAIVLNEVLFDHASGKLRDYLEQLDLQQAGINTTGELISHLLAATENNTFSYENIRDALALGLDNELSDAELLKYSLMRTSGDNLKSYLEQLDLDAKRISTEDGFYKHLDRITGQGAKELRDYLIDEGPESLSDFLRQLNLSAEGINTVSDLIAYLLKHIDETGISEEELMELIAGFLEEALASFGQGDPVATEDEDDNKALTTALTIILSSGFLVFVIFLVFRRRRKDKKVRE